MLPMSSSNHHTHIEPSWRTYCDAKRLLRQTEQRLNDARNYNPHVHLNNHYDTIEHPNLSTTSSVAASYLLHSESSTLPNGNRSMFPDDRLISSKHQLRDSEAIQTIRRKINKQKLAAERRAEQLFHSHSDAGHMFESFRPHTSYTTSASLQNLHYSPHRQQARAPVPPPAPTHTPSSLSSRLSQSQSFPSELDAVLRHSSNSRTSHRENDFERSSNLKNMNTILPKGNYSLTNGRAAQQRSASASNGLASKYQDLPPSRLLTPTDSKYARRLDTAHPSSGQSAKTSLIPSLDGWRTDHLVSRKVSSAGQQERPTKKSTAAEIISKRSKTDEEEPSSQRIEKIIKAAKRDTSASKPSVISADKTPLKPTASKPKSDEEKRKIQDYMQQKRQQQEEFFLHDRRQRDEQERGRKDKLRKLTEPTSDVSQAQLLSKRPSAFTPVTTKDFTEQTRQRLLRLLGSSTDNYVSSVFEQSPLRERSLSSSSDSSTLSSSSNSVVEAPADRNGPLSSRSRSEPPVSNGQVHPNGQRQDTLLRWATNLTRDCDVVEKRFKYFRPDVIQSYDSNPSSYQHLQYDNGNLRYPEIQPAETNKSSLVSRTSRRSNQSSEYRDSALDRRVYRDRAAAKIQAAYRGYSVRKSLTCLNEKQKNLPNDYNQRHSHTQGKVYSEKASVHPDRHFTYANASKIDYQSKSQRKQAIYSEDYENLSSSSSSFLSTPTNAKPQHRAPDLASAVTSSSTTPVPSPEPALPSPSVRRRSMSPPLPPAMSPDNGRPLPHLPTNLTQPATDQQQIHIQLSIVDSTENPTKTTERSNMAGQPLPFQSIPISEQSQRKSSPARQASSSSSSSSASRKRKSRSPAPPQQTVSTHSRHRTSQNLSPPTSSSESILTAREKRVRQKFNSDVELQAYEKRLKDIEKKIRQLVKRAFEIFDEKRSISSPPAVPSSSKADGSSQTRSKSINVSHDQSSISEEPSLHDRFQPSVKKDNDTSAISTQLRQSSEPSTSDVSDLERRVRDYSEQLKAKKNELERLKQRKNKEILRRQEDALKRQIQSYDQEIQALRLQHNHQEQTVPIPSPQSSWKAIRRSSSSTSTSNSITEQKSPPRFTSTHDDQPLIAKETEIYSRSSDVSPDHEKEPERRPETSPIDQFDGQKDARSIADRTDPFEKPQSEHDSRRSSIEQDKSNIDHSALPKAPEEAVSSSSSTTATSSEKPPPPAPVISPRQESAKSPSTEEQSSPSSISEPSPAISPQLTKLLPPSPPPAPPVPIIAQKSPQSISNANGYDDDFSEASQSVAKDADSRENLPDLDIDSISEDLEHKPPIQQTQASTSSKSSDEQSVILVIGEKSLTTTPTKQEKKTVEDEFPHPPTSSAPLPSQSIIPNDDTSRDISEAEDDEVTATATAASGHTAVDQPMAEKKIDQLTETLIRTFIDEAIDQGKEIEQLKQDTSSTKEPSESTSGEDLSDEDQPKQSTLSQKDDFDNAIDILAKQPNFQKKISTANSGNDETDELEIDLSPLDERNPDEPRVESPRKITIEEPVKPIVSHTRDQVLRLTHEAVVILYNQNEGFSDRTKIDRTIPESFFQDQEQDSDTEEMQRSRRAYCRMIFDLCHELLHEMHSPNVRTSKYPDWQKSKLVSKRFYRMNQPQSRDEAERFIQQKVLEILNLTSRDVTYSKWRMPMIRRRDVEQFELVLDEELRRTETNWINYDDDCIRIKLDIAEHIFEQLIEETFTECVQVINKRMLLSSSHS